MASALGTRDAVNAARSLPGGAPAPRAHVAAKQEALSERNSKPLGMMFKIFYNPAQPAFPHLSFSRLLQITLIGPATLPGLECSGFRALARWSFYRKTAFPQTQCSPANLTLEGQRPTPGGFHTY